MLKSVIKCGTATPITICLPSAGDLKGNPDTIFCQTTTVKGLCNMSSHLCIHNQTVVLYNDYYVLKDCTLENSRQDEKALIFAVITSGSATEIISGHQVEHSAGAVNMGIMSSDNQHIMQLAAGSRLTKVSLIMSESDFKIYNERYPIILSRFVKHFSSNKPFMGNVIDKNEKILEAANDLQNAILSKNINPYYVEGLIVEFLVNYYYEVFKQPLPDNYTVCRKIFKARSVLTKKYQNPPTLRELATKVGTNECTLKKVFKQMFSMTVFDYLNDFRMNKATHLLSNNKLSVNEIANELGFSSQAHFCNSFRKKYGINPTEYRKNQQT